MFNKLIGTGIAALVLLGATPLLSAAATTTSQSADSAFNASERSTLTSLNTQSTQNIDSKTVSFLSLATSKATDQNTSISSDKNSDLLKPVPNLVAPQSATSVSTWADFTKALTDKTTTAITVTAPLKATSSPTVNKDIPVDFGGNTLDMQSQSINIAAGFTLAISNVNFTGTTKGALASGAGTLQLTGNITTSQTNAAPIALLGISSVVIDAANLQYASTGTAPAIIAPSLKITGDSVVNATAASFYKSGAKSGETILIDKQSSVITTGTTTGKVWDIGVTTNFTITDYASLTASSSATGDNVPISIVGANSTLNVTGSAHLSVESQFTSALIMLGDKASFNVDNHSEIDLTSNGDVVSSQATLWFKQKGNMTFNVTNHSAIKIVKTKDSGKTADAPAIRMFGANNKINVTGGSDFDVTREAGTQVGTPGGIAGASQAIQFTADSNGSSGNAFTVTDPDSSVSISSVSGPAIDASGVDIGITAGAGTYFVARGNTASANSGIFIGANLQFSMDSVKYFDFRNNRTGGGQVFSAGSGSSFTSKNSDLAVWKNGSNLDGNPTYQWANVNFALSGQDFATLSSTSDANMQSHFGAVTQYSRLSANNQAAIIDDLRVPTNADKYVYAHASVPEGKGEARDAYDNEVLATIALNDPSGKQVAKLSGVSDGDPMSVYGDASRKGMIKIPAPNATFLPALDTLKVLSATLGQHDTPASDLPTSTPQVYDVTPPDPTTVQGGKTTIAPTTKTVSGTGEAGAEVQVYLNGTDTGLTTTVAADGTYSVNLPNGLVKGDVVQLRLKDHAGPAGNTNPPATNDSIGNIEPAADMAYHDANFAAATTLTVAGSLSLVTVPDTFDFGQHEITTQTQTYYPTVKGSLEIEDTRGDGKSPWQLTLREADPLHSGTHDLSGLLTYTNKTGKIALSGNAAVVESGQFSTDGSLTISDSWNDKTGLSIEVPASQQLLGEYDGTLEWSLQDVPANQ
ncbi:Ig-like domain-containing protein [Lacticaseibacillus brantae]|uniref:Bacterial Ig domain-containing protein n=1 Tax=Lacticaseibacillus brantae DSM 23927 TaxID=1423727 RepID=A0A0R2AV21_9LACO|nr:Ig-like domain-containing protein [Lacticaseibacillus brantae]KRM71262.1 hypothetical protein FC34_GL001740 [Lacticaseibacillus brantae DSM 23927]